MPYYTSQQQEGGEYVFEQRNATLADGATIQSGWIDMNNVTGYSFLGIGGTAGSGFNLVIESYTEDAGGGVGFSSSTDYTQSNFIGFTVFDRLRYLRFTWTNNTGAPVDAYMGIKLIYEGTTRASIFPPFIRPTIFSPAMFTQSLFIGQNAQTGDYDTVTVNQGQAFTYLRVFGRDRAWKRAGILEGGKSLDKILPSPLLQPLKISGQVEMTILGLMQQQNENLQLVSSSANDVGSVVSSGTATGGSSATLVDSGATFVTDGVSVGDVVTLDDQGFHGIVSEVTSETVLTVHKYSNGGRNQTTASSGDSYRVVTSTSTGVGLVRVNQILNSDYEEQTPVYVVMNGTTSVNTVVDTFRCTRAFPVHAGSAGGNVGTITGRQATTTANVFFQIAPGVNQTTVGAFTIPAGKTGLLYAYEADASRTNGSAGSATISLRIREVGGNVFRSSRYEQTTTEKDIAPDLAGGIALLEKSDVKVRAEVISDSTTSVSASFVIILIDDNINN